MTSILPEAVREGLEQARRAALRRNDRLCVHDGDQVYRIRKFWDHGMTIDSHQGAKLRGRVEIFDGARHVFQALVVNSQEEGDEIVLDFKWLHPVTDTAPVDFVRPDFVPAGLIARA